VIRVLIVDDSAIVRDVLSTGLAANPDIEVIGTAANPFIARNKILADNPDVITLDIEMPGMDGLSFLKIIMHYRPLPVIIISSVAGMDKNAALEALSLGAFDVINKPDGNLSVQGLLEEISGKIRLAYEHRDNFRSRQLAIKAMSSTMPDARGKNLQPGEKSTGKQVTKESVLSNVRTSDNCIAIGASTGGTLALEYILPRLPANLPPILIVQHMPRNFTAQFASRLDGLSKLKICEASDKVLLQRGNVYVAPGGQHLEVIREGSSVYTRLAEGPKVQYQKPSADVLFASIAMTFGRNALGLLLTGMGRDGAEGLLQMKKKGARTIIQNEESCVVWGMPRAARELDAQTEEADLSIIPAMIAEYAGAESARSIN